jgi:geranylgeranyl diphosphate synthase type II
MNSKYSEYLNTVNSSLAGFIPESENGQDIITQAMQYSLKNGGKRVRPVLTLEFCNIICGDYTRAIPFACAVEMIHTYSLIHDDLPCMDNDDMRRGKPANHIEFGEANALLAGDALLTHAFETAAKGDTSAEAKVKAILVLSSLAGVNGMIGGQVLDLKNEGKSISQNELITTHNLKTGALIKAACELGCIAADANENELRAADEYAGNLGLAFQIIDDILDVTGDEATLGKPVGSDSENEKTTFVTLFGIEKAKQMAEEYTLKAVNALNAFGGNTEFLKELAYKLTERNS